jgi:hypothetical protein
MNHMLLTAQLNLSQLDLVLLSNACHWASVYYREVMLPRLQERDFDALLDLGYDPEEGEEEGEFINALEGVNSDMRELALLIAASR